MFRLRIQFLKLLSIHLHFQLAFLEKWKGYADSANTLEPKDVADTIRRKQSELGVIDKNYYHCPKSKQTLYYLSTFETFYSICPLLSRAFSHGLSRVFNVFSMNFFIFSRGFSRVSPFFTHEHEDIT